ncbi:MAG: LysM peptidoglycan-binding domain-containing protein [Anaerolineaceae bacterium]|nr:LysM peptidoglycan-binding domain-containing protein [Anaerolineaceae bacterium]
MNDKCPFFGLEDDPETAATFPTDRNRCYRLSKPKSVGLDQQSSYCLTPGYKTCPIFQQQPPKPLALSDLPKPSAVISNPFFLPVTVMLVAFLAMVSLFFYARSIWGDNFTVNLFVKELSNYSFTSPTHTPTHLPSATPTLALPSSTSTPTITLTPTITDTETPVPTVLAVTITDPPSSNKSASGSTHTTRTATLYPTATVCGRPPSGWISYTIRYGDTLNSIAVAYGTTIAQLQSANCMGSSITIYAGNSLYVPYAATQVAISTITSTSAPAPTKTRRPVPTNTPIPPTTKPPVPPPDTAVPPSDTPIPPPAPTDTTAPYPSI